VLIDGVPVEESRARCGFTFQTDAVFPWMTVAGNVGYGLRWSGRSPQQRRVVVDHYLQRVGLTGFADHWPRELSGGMRKRVDLARAFAVDPPVLLLDEPFGSLDSLTRVQMQHLLLEVWRTDRKTLMLVTHDVEEALFLGEKVAVMSNRPARVTRVISVPFSAEDRVADLKLAPEFIALRRELLATLGAPG
jgi:NitT/TauT family transport system ATP-binding protein